MRSRFCALDFRLRENQSYEEIIRILPGFDASNSAAFYPFINLVEWLIASWFNRKPKAIATFSPKTCMTSQPIKSRRFAP